MLSRDLDIDADEYPEWKPVSALQLIAVILVSIFVLYLTHTGERWVPLLDSANLAFHEFGHPFFSIFNSRLMFYGGTLGQLAFPITTMIVFWKRRETISFALCGLWLCENFFNIARYMADARALELPLVGGGGEDRHDWFNILSSWGALHLDTKIASVVNYVAIAGTLALCFWLYFLWIQRDSDAT